MTLKLLFLAVVLSLIGTQVALSQVVKKKWDMTMLTNIHWLDDPKVGLVIAEPTGGRSTVYKTSDGGFTWTDLTSKLDGSISIQPLNIHVNYHNKTVIYISGQGKIAWFSEDRAQNWTKIEPPELYESFKWHPVNSMWALAVKQNTFGSRNTVYLTRDIGRSWVQIRENVYYDMYSWGDAGRGDVPVDRIYMITADGSDTIPFNFIQTDDYCTKEVVLQPRGYQFIFMRHQLFVAVYLPTVKDVALKVTPDVNKNYKHFYESKFPFGDTVDNNGYVILDDSTGAAYIGINHGDYTRSHWGNIYASDSTGSRYVNSLLHVGHRYTQYGPLYDFDVIRGLEGVYIANVLTNWEDSTSRTADQLQTYMTLNNGASWVKLSPPHVDSNGDKIVCTGDCSLHLNGWTGYVDDLGPFYSSPTAIGLIIATGSIGEYLSHKSNEINTYMSRDGGLHWSELRKGSSIYEFGDHGGIIVIAPYGTTTDTIYYSLTEGTTPLSSYTFTDTPVEIDNIMTEPLGTTEVFILYARDGSVYSFDFTGVFTRTCDLTTDYELWSPDDGFGTEDKHCLMGRTVTYRRRKASSACFNPEDIEHVISTENCTCIDDDFECDFGYDRDGSGACVLVGSAPTYPPEDCQPGDVYYKTKGYRKEPGNTCQGGVDLAPVGPFDCPDNALDTITKSKGWIAALVVVPLVLVLIVFGLIAVRNEKIRDKLPFLKCLGTWRVGYFGMQAPDTPEDDEMGNEDPIDQESQPNQFSVDLDQDEIPPSRVPPTVGSINIDDDFNPRGH